MNRLLNTVINYGAHSKLSKDLLRKVKLTNSVSVAFASIIFSLFLLFFMLKLDSLALKTVPFSILFFSPFLLNKNRWYDSARVVLSISLTIVTYVFSSALGEESNFHFWFVPAGLVPFLIFTLQKKKLLIFCTVLNFIVLLFLLFSKFKHPALDVPPISPLRLEVIAVLMILGSFLTTFAMTLFLISEYEKIFKINDENTQILRDYAFALNASSIVAVADEHGKIIYVNDKFCESSGYTRSELIGRSYRILNSGHHSKDFYKNIWKTILDNRAWNGEVCNKNKNGMLYWLAATVMQLNDEHGKAIRYVSICHDITQGKLAEQSSFQSARLASIGEMSSGIAHEINNPVGIIHARASQLLRQLSNNTKALSDAKSSEKFGEQLKKIISETSRISTIVRGLRTFSRSGDQDPFSVTNLNAIFDDVLSLCSERFKQSNISLLVDPMPPIQIECRSVQIAQVLSNLLNNAYDAVTVLKERWIKVQITTTSDFVKISVTDSGKGIPVAVAEKLMQPFFTTKETGKGTGLGLSISKGIIESHGGRFWLDQNCSNTKFVLEIPMQQNKKKAA